MSSAWVEHIKALAEDAAQKEDFLREAMQRPGIDTKSKAFRAVEAEAEAAFNELHTDIGAHELVVFIEAFERANEIVKLFAWLRDRVKTETYAGQAFAALNSPGLKRHTLDFGWTDSNADAPRDLEQAIRDAMDGLDTPRLILPPQ